MAPDDEGNADVAGGRLGKPRDARRFSLAAAMCVGGIAWGVATGTSGAAGPLRGSCGSTAPKLTVQGTGQATATPNVLTVVVQVSASGSSATVALSTDNTLAGGVAAVFKRGGVAAKDIQSSDLTLAPQYAYSKGVPTVTGYQVSDSITASLRDIAASGGVIDAVVGSGGNALQIESIAFSVSHPDLVQARARSAATAQAIAHATTLAGAAGRSLGPLCALRDESAVSDAEKAAANYSLAAPSAAAGVPIESGSQTQYAYVTLVYALGPAIGRDARSAKT